MQNVHWVAVTVDFINRRLEYADSQQKPIPSELLDILAWWASFYFVEFTSLSIDFQVDPLPCTIQGEDSYLCGLIAVNALQHRFLPWKYPLTPIADVDLARISIFQEIVAPSGAAVCSKLQLCKRNLMLMSYRDLSLFARLSKCQFQRRSLTVSNNLESDQHLDYQGTHLHTLLIIHHGKP